MTKESILNHARDTSIKFTNLLQNTLEISVDEVGGTEGEAASGCKVGGDITGLVDRRDGEGVDVARGGDEAEDGINGLERVGQVLGRVEPSGGTDTSAGRKTVDTAGKGVETDDDVHTVTLDGIIADGLEVSLLVTGVKTRARD